MSDNIGQDHDHEPQDEPQQAPPSGRKFRPANRSANRTPTPAPAPTAAPAAPVSQARPSTKVGFDAIRELVTKKRDAIASLIPAKTVDVEPLTQSALQMVMADRRLCLCSPRSILNCIYAVAKLGLDFMDENAFLVPREKKADRGKPTESHETWYCSLLIGYRGMIAVAARFGWYLDSQEIRKGDVYEIDAGTQNVLSHKIRLNERGDVEGVYCVTRDIQNRVHHIEIMDLQAIEQVRQDTDPWKYHFDRMCRKSVIRRAYTSIPKASLDMKLVAELDKRWDEERPVDDLVSIQGQVEVD